eukprot:1242687-Pyramimonas_sp.AAC.1
MSPQDGKRTRKPNPRFLDSAPVTGTRLTLSYEMIDRSLGCGESSRRAYRSLPRYNVHDRFSDRDIWLVFETHLWIFILLTDRVSSVSLGSGWCSQPPWASNPWIKCPNIFKAKV